MIVTDDNVSAALEYLAIEPHPIAVARHSLTLAENKVEMIFAELYPKTEGTVKERECDIERNGMYRDAKIESANAQMELERHKARIRSSEMVCEIWRTENANARAAERMR